MVTQPIVWLIILVVLIIIELVTLGLTTIWFAGGSLAAFIAAVAGGDIYVQVGLFLVVSVVLLLFTRPFAVKFLNKTRTSTNADSYIGKQAVVLEAISNLQSKGKVTFNGIEWTARTKDDKEIEKDSIVNIIAIDGVKLIVEKK